MTATKYNLVAIDRIADKRIIDAILTLDKEDLMGAAVELVEARQRLKGAIALQAVAYHKLSKIDDKAKYLEDINYYLGIIDDRFKVLAKWWQDEREDGIAGCFYGLRYDVTKMTE